MAPPPAPPPAAPEPAAAAAEAEARRFVTAVLVYFGLVVLVFAHQVLWGHGALASPGALLAELHGGEGGPWQMGEELPYRYRPLFRWLVLGAFELLPERDAASFYGLFVTASAVSLFGAALALDWLLRTLGFSGRQALLGGALFLTGFPVLFSHDMPIHTREDLLGYAWIALTLVAVARDRPLAVAGLGVVGVWIRETCLLGVLPLWLVSRRPPPQRALAYLLPGLSLLLLRAVRGLPGQRYDYVGISTAPTLEYPLEALLYLFATFGALWVLAGLRLADPAPPRHPLLARRVALLALAATALTGWTMGMIREARITYILFPFVVPLALDALGSPRVRAAVRSPAAWAAGGAVLVAGWAGLAWLAADSLRVIDLWPYLGESFQPGVVPRVPFEGPSGEEVLVEVAHASPLNGPVVLLHLAASAALLVGALATRRAGPEGS